MKRREGKNKRYRIRDGRGMTKYKIPLEFESQGQNIMSTILEWIGSEGKLRDSVHKWE